MARLSEQIDAGVEEHYVEANGDTLSVTEVIKAQADVDATFVDAVKTVEVSPDGITVKGITASGTPYENKLVEIGEWGDTAPTHIPLEFGAKCDAYDLSGYWQAPHAINEISGHVSLGGLVKVLSGQTIVAGDVIANLPVGVRPEGQSVFLVASYAGPMRLDIKTTGEIVVATMQSGAQQSTQWVSLDGIRFVAAVDTLEE